MACIYIFKDEKDRKNEEMYEKLAKLVEKIGVNPGLVPAYLCIATRAEDCFRKLEDSEKFTEKDPTRGQDNFYRIRECANCSYTIEKGDIFLEVGGFICEMNKKTLLHAAKTTEERKIASKVKIMFSKPGRGDDWSDVLKAYPDSLQILSEKTEGYSFLEKLDFVFRDLH